MKLIELKCKNCGAKLEVEEGTTQITCKFCDTTFSIDDAYTQGYKYTKGVLKAQDEQREKDFQRAKEFLDNTSFGKTPKLAIAFFIFVFVLIFGIVGYGIYSIVTEEKDNSFDVRAFNTIYETNSGKQSGFFITNILDDIVTNNKTKKNHVISVSYNDVTTTNEKEIKEIRNSLSSGKYYDVTLDYDNEGYVNKFTIEDIKTDKKTENDTTQNDNSNSNNGSVNQGSVNDFDMNTDTDTSLDTSDFDKMQEEYDKMKAEVEQKMAELKEKMGKNN